MKAISLTQPWATLVAIGAKEWETRSWPTTFRGQIAIHASKSYPGWAKDLENASMFRRALSPGGVYTYPMLGCGHILAIATITDCRRTDEFFSPGSAGEASKRGVIISPEEFAFGDFTAGRYAFRLDNVLRLPQPIPCRGALSLWTVPDDATMEIFTQLRELQKAAR